MVLEEGEILTLNQQEYIVIDVVNYLNQQYAYLISNFKPLDVIIAKVTIDNDNLSLEEVEDKKIIEEILKIVSIEE